MKEIITPEYQALLQQKHATKAWGGGGWSWIPEVVRLIIEYQLRETPTVLDYGAGRRTFRDTMGWLMPHVCVVEYDPGVPHIDKWPPWRAPPGNLSKVDLTLCTDVMEHVEERFVNETFRRIRDATTHAVFFNIALTPSKSLLPNGANAHLTVHPADWWENEAMKVFPEINTLPHHKGFTFVARIKSKL